MDWYIWVLVVVGILILGTKLFRTGKAEPEFNAAEYSYSPSAAVRDLVAKGDEVEAIRLIRADTGLGLKDGRDLYLHLKA